VPPSGLLEGLDDHRLDHLVADLARLPGAWLVQQPIQAPLGVASPCAKMTQ
jgi:hypothetical protein